MSVYEVLKDRIGLQEAKIIRQVALKALGQGWLISVDDGGEEPVGPLKDLDQVLSEVGHTDETYFIFFKPNGQPKTHVRAGMVWFVHGNDEDVVTDHSDNEAINALMEGVY